MRQLIGFFDPNGSGRITLSDFCDGVSSLIKSQSKCVLITDSLKHKFTLF